MEELIILERTDDIGCLPFEDEPQKIILSELGDPGATTCCITDSCFEELGLQNTSNERDILKGKAPHENSSICESFCCYLCNEVFPTNSTLQFHFVRDHNIKIESSNFCSLCNYEYWTDDQLNYHFKKHHGVKNTNLTCNTCVTEYPTQGELMTHLATHSLSYSCLNSDAKYASKQDLNQSHLADLKPYLCYCCSKRFHSVIIHNMHLLRHKKQKCLKSGCPKEFEDESWLLYHLNKVHRLSDTKLQQVLTFRKKVDEELDNIIKNASATPQQEIILVKNYCETLLKSYETNYGTSHDEQFVKLVAVLLKGILKIIGSSSINSSEIFNTSTTGRSYAVQNDVDAVEEEVENKSIVSKKVHRCYVCYWTFNTLKQLRRHASIHKSLSNKKESQEKNVVVCAECGKVVSSLSSLERHQRLSHLYLKNNNHKCPHCKKLLKKKSYLKEHLLKTHKICSQVEPFTCSICNKVLSSERHLALHLKIHSGKNAESPPLYCSKCKISFVRENKFMKHMENHKLVHTCSICHKKYLTLGKLSSHLVSHSAEMKRRFSCAKCPLTFSYKSQLQIHLRIHTGEKPYMCDICDKSFKRLQHLKIHASLVHCSDKKTQCPECEKLFGTKANLFRHRLVYHYNLRRWICGVCAKNYCYSQDLKCHLLKKHNIHFKALEYCKKKSKFEIYIIPEIGTHLITDANKLQIEDIFHEEKTKLNDFRNQKLKMKPSGDPKPPISTKKKDLDQIQNTKPKSLSLNFIGYGECVHCLIKIFITSGVVLCNLCNAFACSISHLNSHFLASHSSKFVCLSCDIVFMTRDSCIDHVKKVHSGTLVSTSGEEVSTHFVAQKQIKVQVLPLLESSVSSQSSIIQKEKSTGSTYSGMIASTTKDAQEISFEAVPSQDAQGVQLISKPVNTLIGNSENANQQQTLEFILQNSQTKGLILPKNSSNSQDYNRSDSLLNTSITIVPLAHELKEQALQDEINLHRGCAINQNYVPVEETPSQSFQTITKDLSIPSIVLSGGSLNESNISDKIQPPLTLEVKDKTDPEPEGRVKGPTNVACDVCTKTFDKESKLKRHKKIHKEASFVCSICGKSFVEKYNLEKHRLIHTQEKPLQCELCDKSFRYSRDLKDHINHHNNTLPFSCPPCGISFLRQKDLARHNKEQHTDDRQYKCPDCDKTFKRKSYFEKFHLPIHRKKKDHLSD